MKGNFTLRVLDSLWNTVNEYAKLKDITVGNIIEEYGKSLIIEPKPLMIRPNRKVTKYHKAEEFTNRFPMKRRTLYLDVNFINELTIVYEKMAIEQYDSKVKLNFGAIIHTILYYSCISNRLEIDNAFFDDAFFEQQYTYGEQDVMSAIHKTIFILGKFPTSREYHNLSINEGLPSINVLKERFGSYKKALNAYENSIGGEKKDEEN